MTFLFRGSSPMRTVTALAALALLAGLSLPVAAQFRQPKALNQDSSEPLYTLDSGRLGVVESSWGRKMLFGGVGEQGFNPTRAGLLEQGLSVTPSLLRDLPPAPQLGPATDQAGLPQTGAYLGYRVDKLLLSSSVRQSFGTPGVGGARLDLGASYGFNLTPRHLITLSGGLTLGQPTAVAPYAAALGSDALARWGYRVGEPGAGFRLSWQYSWDRNLYLSTTLGYDRAYGDTAENLQGTAASFGTLFGYRW